MSDFNRLIGSILGIEDAIKEGAENGLKQAGARVVGAAKQKLGTYQPSVGEYPAWQVLKPASIAAKYRSSSGKGIKKSGKEYLRRYGSFQASGTADDSPLVDTGALRQAITMDTGEVSEGKVYIGVAKGKKKKKRKGKTSDVATYASVQEYGSAKKNIPPRPYLRPAVVENKEQIAEDIKNGIAEMMASFGQGRF